MIECKRCGSTEAVKNGMVRGKQRYLCKQCGYHFVYGDERENRTAVVSKALCTIFQALGVTQCKTVGKYLNRDASLIHRWMNEKPNEYERYRTVCTQDFTNINSLLDELKLGDIENGNPMLLVNNIVDDLYIAVIVQRRDNR